MRVLTDAVVATDSERIGAFCRTLGAPVVMTSPDHESGTDRVAEVLARPGYADVTHVVNIQGDEPLLAEEHLERAVELVTRGGWDIGTCAAPLFDLDAYMDPSVVKLARAADGRALYFSRSPIPHVRERRPSREELACAPFLRHIGLYAYTRDALARWVAREPSPLERLERLEQLRALESGLRIGVAVVDRAAPGVDTPDDVIRIESILDDPAVSPFA
jgi:3-deoxy-manno-octulosonate cytidylyltransferase (CMP-KDO synthetase)